MLVSMKPNGDKQASGVERVMALALLGGHPALDLVNTVDWRDREDREETLVSYAALLACCRRLGLISPDNAEHLERAARLAPAEAAGLLPEALALREATARLVEAGRGAPADLALVNRWLAQPNAAAALKPNPAGGYRLAEPEAADLAAPLRAIARAAADLLTSSRLRRVRCCGGPGCGWLFLDTSPNGRRRWCSMEGCGNRAKAKRHYRKAIA
jgi:predicted RNA-binding Zn ribbon-like protein